MGDPKNIIERAGFKRRHDYDHTYKTADRWIKNDTDKMILDGYLTEFHGDDLCKDLIEENNHIMKDRNRGHPDKPSTLMFTVDVENDKKAVENLLHKSKKDRDKKV